MNVINKFNSDKMLTSIYSGLKTGLTTYQGIVDSKPGLKRPCEVALYLSESGKTRIGFDPQLMGTNPPLVESDGEQFVRMFIWRIQPDIFDTTDAHVREMGYLHVRPICDDMSISLAQFCDSRLSSAIEHDYSLLERFPYHSPAYEGEVETVTRLLLWQFVAIMRLLPSEHTLNKVLEAFRQYYLGHVDAYYCTRTYDTLTYLVASKPTWRFLKATNTAIADRMLPTIKSIYLMDGVYSSLLKKLWSNEMNYKETMPSLVGPDWYDVETSERRTVPNPFGNKPLDRGDALGEYLYVAQTSGLSIASVYATLVANSSLELSLEQAIQLTIRYANSLL